MLESAPGAHHRLDTDTEGADESADAVPFTLDGRPARGRPGEVIISAAERAGTYIPRFCYHPRMKPVGMCRMCLVEVSGPRGATLQPACFVTVAEGMEVTTTSDKVKKAQDGVLEFLLVNHPLDCPVCDKGGECPLQDQTLAYGPGESRFVEEKRHFEKPIAISDLVLLDRERCIQCARSTRFADEVAGDPLIDFAGRGERVEVATFPDEPFRSYFSGNTVQICPVGALTATPYRFTARPWDLDQVESTCTTCAFGCRTAVQSSTNRLTRLLGLDADPVNQSWLCDKGRFVFESVNGDEISTAPQPEPIADATVDVVPATAAQIRSVGASRGQFMGEVAERREARTGRLAEPLVRKDGELVAAGWGEALAAAAAGITKARDAGGPGAVAFVGGARCTNEGAYAWTKLAKSVVGTDSVDAQLADGLPAELVLSLPRATVDEACRARTVVLLTGDLREELPVLFLRLRHAAIEKQTALVELSGSPTSLTRHAAVSLRVRPGDAPAIVDALVSHESGVPGHHEGRVIDDADLARARALVLGEGAGGGATGSQPMDGSGVVVVLGRPSLAEHGGVTAAAARRLAEALPGARFLPALRRGNVLGALELGMSPGLLPGRVSLETGRDWFAAGWGKVPAARGLTSADALESLAGGGGVRALVVVGADLPTDFADHDLARRALDAAELVVAVTGHPTPVLEWADVVLPVAVAHERPGSTTNVESRVSRLGQKIVPPGQAWPDWMIATELAAEMGGDLGFGSAADVWAEIERLAPLFAGVTTAVLESPGARDGVVVPYRPLARPSAVLPNDPMATPGVESVERQGAPPRVGLSEPAGAEDALAERPVLAATGDVPVASPAPGAGLDALVDALAAPHVAPADSYSFRLVAARRLYDSGSAVAHSPSLVPLVDEAVARANPYDLDRIGAADGDTVTVRSARGTLTLPCAGDETVPRGVVAVDFNLPSPDMANAAAVLVDVTSAVTDVHLESVR
ncbi:MAG: molybdopterin-dependent oxidoreductase [Acidimicrobiales bacterium]